MERKIMETLHNALIPKNPSNRTLCFLGLDGEESGGGRKKGGKKGLKGKGDKTRGGR